MNAVESFSKLGMSEEWKFDVLTSAAFFTRLTQKLLSSKQKADFNLFWRVLVAKPYSKGPNKGIVLNKGIGS